MTKQALFISFLISLFCLSLVGCGASEMPSAAQRADQIGATVKARSTTSTYQEIASCTQPLPGAPKTYLRGINFSGKDYSPGDQWPVKPAVAYFITKKKMTIVRLALKWELLQPQLNGPLAPEMLAGIDDQIDRITAEGAVVILDIHNGGRRDVDGKPYIIGESAFVTSSHFDDLWRRMATRWGNRCGIVFGLMNEPHEQDDAVLVRVTNSAIQAIRTTGARNLILVNGNNWNSLAWKAGAPNYTYVGAQVVDPADNMAFDIHHYFDDWSAGVKPNCNPNTWQASFEAFTTWARTHNKRAFVGEFAVGPDSVCAAELKGFLDYLNANPDVWMGWAWWGGGGWWPYDYPFRLDPYGSRWDGRNPEIAAAANWDAPVDRPQMAILTPYLQ